MDGQNLNNSFEQQSTAPVENKANGMSIAALVLGILGIVLGCCWGVLGVIFGAIGLVLGILGNKQSKTKLGTAGIVVSAVAIGLGLIIWIIGAVFAASLMEELSNYGYY